MQGKGLIKGVGCLLLLLLTLYLARALSQKRKRRLYLSEGLLLLLNHLCASLSSASLPLSAIYASFYHEGLAQVGFLADLKEEGLAYALERAREVLCLTEEERALLCPFAKRLGKGFLAEEKALCLYTAESFVRLYQGQKEAFSKKHRAEQALVLTGGLMVILLLL